jgi:L-iditol 2-dehydrogenase
MKHVYPRAIALAQAGLVDLQAIVSHHYPLERTSEAFEQLATGPGGAIKVVVEP